MIRVRDLRVDYDDFCAVRDLSLQVDPGHVCGLIGPNGAGKTTTMRTMIGLIEPTYGSIEMAGVDMREHPADACRKIAFMPDFAPLYEDLKVWEFLDCFAASYGVPRPRRRSIIDEHLEVVGLAEKRTAMIAGLSRGMRQRLVLAKSLIPDPEVLLLDEPASGVDPQGRIDLKNTIIRLAAEGKTILLSSHILAEMTEFCTSVAIMEKGSMVISGTIEEVQARVAGAGVMLVEVLDVELAGPIVRRVAEADPHADAVHAPAPGRFEIIYHGGAAEAAGFLAELIRAGVRVSSFTRKREGLEELFLKVGAMELS
jgi:ABC-2 type transport system ATP-binding protein